MFHEHLIAAERELVTEIAWLEKKRDSIRQLLGAETEAPPIVSSAPAKEMRKPRAASKRKVPNAAEAAALEPAVWSALEVRSGLSCDELATDINEDAAVVSKTLVRLIKQGKVSFVGQFRKKRYSLAEQPAASEQHENGSAAETSSENPIQEG